MSQLKTSFKVISDTTLRRLRSTPGYFFLIWRWSMWLYALVLISFSHPPYTTTIAYRTSIIILFITFLQTVIVTFYAPVIQILVPRMHYLSFLQRLPLFAHQQKEAGDDETNVVTPLAHAGNPRWNIAIYALDVIICGIATYLTGPFGIHPNFGTSSPFYRYGMSTALAAAVTYRYRGALAAAIAYDLFVVFTIFFPPFNEGEPYNPNVIDVAGSLIDTPVAAFVAAYVVSLLVNITQNNSELKANIRQQRALRDVGETLIRESSEKQRLLQSSAEQLSKGGSFQRLIIALVNSHDEEQAKTIPLAIDTLVEVESTHKLLPIRSNEPLERVRASGEPLITFEPQSRDSEHYYGLARLYLPFYKEGHVSMILGAESWRQGPFALQQKNFLTIAGNQLLIALDNIRLTEQTIQLAAVAERGRIAREIHDGVSQLVYMLSLNAETCAAQARRITDASGEYATLLTPLEDRLDKQVKISKQALWETRNYMFSLKPLMSGTTTLTQMLTNQLREFETISDIPVTLEVTGDEETAYADETRARKLAKVGTAIFRIVQEALTNAYKHAEATAICVHLRYLTEGIEVEVCDNGKGLPTSTYTESPGNTENFFSGHGMRGMRERARELGGTLEISPSPEGGVTVWTRIPL
jgi:signal transduction histidine kinase